MSSQQILLKGYKPVEVLWYGDRAVSFGGDTPSYRDTIQYYAITSTGNASDFGDLSENANFGMAGSGRGRGVFGKGSAEGYSNKIQKVTIKTTANASDFGDLTVARDQCTCNAPSNGVRCLWAAGAVPGGSDENRIGYTTIMGNGGASDFGDHASGQPRKQQAAVSNATRAVWCGGYLYNNPGATMQYVTIMTTGNSASFGNMANGRRSGAGAGSGTLGRGIVGGGVSPTSPGSSGTYNYIDYFAVDTTGDGTDFGDLTQARYVLGGTANATRATFCGGFKLGPSQTLNRIDYVEMANTGNASDFGDMIETIEKNAATSGD